MGFNFKTKIILGISLIVILYLLIPTKVSTRIDAIFGKKVYQVFSPSMIYWRINILDDHVDETGRHVVEYFAGMLSAFNYKNNSIDRNYYLGELKTIFEVLEKGSLPDKETQNKLLIFSIKKKDFETFEILYNGFEIDDPKKVSHKFKYSEKTIILAELLKDAGYTVER